MDLELEPSRTSLEMESSWRGLELEWSLASLRVGLELLDTPSIGLLEANPEKQSQGQEVLVAELVPDLGEGFLEEFQDQQSDTCCMNTNSSR